MKEKFYTITAALPYANGPLHVGHLAGAYLPADVFSRYLRARKQNIIFICGSDEHGVAITVKALQQNLPPQAIVNKYHKLIGDTFKELGISFDIYHRTSSHTHKALATDFFLNLAEKNIFENYAQNQYYDIKYEQFLPDRYIIGTCPNCQSDNAYGDQCEKCGSSLSATELVNPRSTLSNEEPVLKATNHWFLPLNKFQDILLRYINSKRKVFRNTVFQQCLGWLNQGLKPRAVTRDLSWGIPVPLANAENKVLYVWFEAPLGYISATQELFNAHTQKNYNEQLKNEYYINPKLHTSANSLKQHWQDPNARVIHFIGKDNIVFHSIIFPAMLFGHGEYSLPDNVVANEFLNLQGAKVSTSRNWAVWLHEYLKDFPNQQDSLRYYLCASAPESKDSDFTWRAFQAHNNNELVAIFGNFVNRVAILIHKYYGGLVPKMNSLSTHDQKFIDKLRKDQINLTNLIQEYKFREAVKKLMDIARMGNRYLADQEPWKQIKSDPGRVQTVLNIALQAVGSLMVLSEPFMPFTSKKLKILLDGHNISWDELLNGKLLNLAGNKINNPELLFNKIDDAVIAKQISKLGKMAS